MRPGQWEGLNKRYRAAVAGWKARQTTVVLAQVKVKERDGRPSVNVIDAALITFSQHWIPTESSYERVFAEKLVREGRAFNKPLRYNLGEDVVFPDFVRTDCASGTVPMEVFGKSDEDYSTRKNEKTAYTTDHTGRTDGGGWDAAVGNLIPAFPRQGRGWMEQSKSYFPLLSRPGSSGCMG